MASVTLLYATPLNLVQSGIRMCWNSQDKSDTRKHQLALSQAAIIDDDFGFNPINNTGPKDLDLIDRIANKNKHSSVLRHSLFVFDIVASTKTLLAFTRHKVGVDFSVQSTRYTTKKNASNLSYTSTENDYVNHLLGDIMGIVQEAINSGAANDDIAMLLPQAFNYRFQVSMNLQAIQHFLDLRTTSHAHYDIREVANLIYEAMPQETKYLLEDQLH